MLAVAVVSRDVTAAPKGEATLSRRLSHRQITPTARSGRVPVAEHRVESSFRCLNSYGRDLVSQAAFENGLKHTFDALPAVQHPLAQEGEARAAEHVAFERLELVHKALGLAVAPLQGQSCVHRRTVAPYPQREPTHLG